MSRKFTRSFSLTRYVTWSFHLVISITVKTSLININCLSSIFFQIFNLFPIFSPAGMRIRIGTVGEDCSRKWRHLSGGALGFLIETRGQVTFSHGGKKKNPGWLRGGRKARNRSRDESRSLFATCWSRRNWASRSDQMKIARRRDDPLPSHPPTDIPTPTASHTRRRS